MVPFNARSLAPAAINRNKNHYREQEALIVVQLNRIGQFFRFRRTIKWQKPCNGAELQCRNPDQHEYCDEMFADWAWRHPDARLSSPAIVG
jgi:hypothetical protein